MARRNTKRDYNRVEVLYVSFSSRDQRRRVLVRDGVIENCLWEDDDLADASLELTGLAAGDVRVVRAFLSGK